MFVYGPRNLNFFLSLLMRKSILFLYINLTVVFGFLYYFYKLYLFCHGFFFLFEQRTSE